jgi:molybdopterin molybdotransferase
MLSYEQAVAAILDSIKPLPAVERPLLDCIDCVSAAPIRTVTDLPPFANSQMDGYAVVASDIAAAAPDAPVALHVVGEVAAGHKPTASVSPGCAVRIFTGAAMPAGADAVVMVEDTRFHAGSMAVEIYEPSNPGQYVRPAGEDAKRGDIVLPAGSVFTPGAIAMAAAAGAPSASVIRRPRIAVISTGDELVPPGGTLEYGQIFESNSYAIAAQVAACGAETAVRLKARDTADSLRDALDQAADADIDAVITSGGVSVGDYDLVKKIFAERGKVDFWKVAIRPGKPFAFGKWDQKLFFGLPGNPASAMVTFELFVRPALRALADHASPTLPVVQAILTADVAHGTGRRSFVRAVATHEDGGLAVRPTGAQGSHLIRPLAEANALLIVPENVETIRAGELVEIMMLA